MLTFDEVNHKYFDGDVELPSVTTITRFCHYDSVNGNGQNPFYRERGTKIHELCADYDFTGELLCGTGVDGYLKAYADFKRDYRIKDWIFVEQMLGSADLGFAGTVDRIGYIDGRLSILDIKSSSNVNLVGLTAQLTGYMALYGARADLYGLQVKKDGSYRLIPVEADTELWNACQSIHSRFKKKEKK